MLVLYLFNAMYNAVPLQHLKANCKQTAVENHLPITQ